MFYWLLVVFLVLILAVGGYLLLSGALYSPEVKIDRGPFGKILICYKFYQRPYGQAFYAFSEINSLVSNKSLKKIGIYYDDPAKVEPNKLRYIVGVVLGDPDNGPVDRTTQEILEDNGYKSLVLPEISSAVVSEFPMYTMLSIMFAVKYAYPKAMRFCQVNKLKNGPFIEYYSGSRLHLVSPLQDQERFIVDEYLDTITNDSYYSKLNSPKKEK